MSPETKPEFMSLHISLLIITPHIPIAHPLTRLLPRSLISFPSSSRKMHPSLSPSSDESRNKTRIYLSTRLHTHHHASYPYHPHPHTPPSSFADLLLLLFFSQKASLLQSFQRQNPNLSPYTSPYSSRLVPPLLPNPSQHAHFPVH